MKKKPTYLSTWKGMGRVTANKNSLKDGLKEVPLGDLGDNCIQNFHLGRYIVRYTVGNLVLRRCVIGAVKRDFRPYIRRYTSPNENFEYGYPHTNALLQFPIKLKRYKPHKAARHPTICDVIKLYCHKYLTLSNQTSRYKMKYI